MLKYTALKTQFIKKRCISNVKYSFHENENCKNPNQTWHNMKRFNKHMGDIHSFFFCRGKPYDPLGQCLMVTGMEGYSSQNHYEGALYLLAHKQRKQY